MDPGCLNPEHYPQAPFGFFFFVGRGYRGFQVRFKDTARGGLRLVMPKDNSQFEASLAGLFDEVYGLAFAQQQKNKDIPEGGSKAVLLLNPGADREAAAIGAVDSLLNLITTNPATGTLPPSIVDHYGKDEFIYLGPDENVTNALIEKFVALAHQQGYRYPNAFMSSKPKNGINHKIYGVTSEGVNVFMKNMLEELHIDPYQQDFTLKLTGGPDGDVAGNALKIMHREFGHHAKVVAIADGFGAAYDPNGLDWPELLRLVAEELPINHFDTKKLSPGKDAYVITADTAEHIRTRNELYATAVADVFLPAGGRPYTVHGKNWKNFFTPEGAPSAKAVVEGANIFFTDEARKALQDRGVMMFKDSSANKCGVICSSFEILASLLWEPEEFVAFKESYVEEVLGKLRSWADLEAKLLLKEFKERGGQVNLVNLSRIVSETMNRVTDLVAAHLDPLTANDLQTSPYRDIILNYIPKTIRDRFPERIFERLPISYQKALVSAEVASTVVYREGVAWFEWMADEGVAQIVLSYMEKEQEILRLIEQLQESPLPEEVIHILRRSGARTLTLLNQSRSGQS
jgi:glutamate dehydrogenase